MRQLDRRRARREGGVIEIDLHDTRLWIRVQATINRHGETHPQTAAAVRREIRMLRTRSEHRARAGRRRQATQDARDAAELARWLSLFSPAARPIPSRTPSRTTKPPKSPRRTRAPG